MSKLNNSKLKKVLLISLLILIIILPISFLSFRYFILISNCNPKYADFGFGSGKIEAPAFKEAGLEVDYYVNEVFDSKGSIYTKEQRLPSFLGVSFCGLDVFTVNSTTNLIFDDKIFLSANDSYLFSMKENGAISKNINLFKNKREYNLDQKYKKSVKEVFSKYQLYKYGKNKEVWVIQENQNSVFEQVNEISPKNLGTLISFDAGKNWLWIDKISRSVPTEHLDPVDENVTKKNGLIFSQDDIIYEPLVDGNLKKDYENRKFFANFILDAGLVYSENEKGSYSDECNMDINERDDIFWITLETKDRQTKQKVYINSSLSFTTGPGSANPAFDCRYEMYRSHSFNEEQTQILNEKLGI
jgi:hypothetical protein